MLLATKISSLSSDFGSRPVRNRHSRLPGNGALMVPLPAFLPSLINHVLRKRALLRFSYFCSIDCSMKFSTTYGTLRSKYESNPKIRSKCTGKNQNNYFLLHIRIWQTWNQYYKIWKSGRRIAINSQTIEKRCFIRDVFCAGRLRCLQGCVEDECLGDVYRSWKRRNCKKMCRKGQLCSIIWFMVVWESLVGVD